MEKQGLGIIFHSGSYDRLYHGLSIALGALALGKEVKFFFSYWALGHLKREVRPEFELDSEAEAYGKIISRNIKEGHMLKIQELFKQAKKLGARFYACTNSMGLLNIARNELCDEVDRSMGVVTFLEEVKGYQILFI